MYRRCCLLAASPVHYATSCKHSLVLLKMDEIIARNMLSWLKLLIKLLLLRLVDFLYYFFLFWSFSQRKLLVWAISRDRSLWVPLVPLPLVPLHSHVKSHGDLYPALCPVKTFTHTTGHFPTDPRLTDFNDIEFLTKFCHLLLLLRDGQSHAAFP